MPRRTGVGRPVGLTHVGRPLTRKARKRRGRELEARKRGLRSKD